MDPFGQADLALTIEVEMKCGRNCLIEISTLRQKQATEIKTQVSYKCLIKSKNASNLISSFRESFGGFFSFFFISLVVEGNIEDVSFSCC